MAEATKPTEAEAAPDWNNLRKERAAAGRGVVVTRADWSGAGPRVDALAPGQPPAPWPSGADRAALKRAWAEWDAAAPAFRDAAMAAETVEALRALGYLD